MIHEKYLKISTGLFSCFFFFFTQAPHVARRRKSEQNTFAYQRRTPSVIMENIKMNLCHRVGDDDRRLRWN